MKDSDSIKHYKRFITKWCSMRSLRNEPITIVLSPHMDDVFLSLNSLIEAKALGGNIIGMNVFTLTDSLVDTNERSDFGTLASTSLTRLKEEVDYSHYLKRKGINYMPLFLGMKDAAMDTYYRYIAGKAVRSVPKLLGLQGRAREHHRKYVEARYSELKIRDALHSAISQFSSISAIVAPIGVGDHIDHMMLRHYAETVSNDFRIGLYADIPYICEYGLMSQEALKLLLPDGFDTHESISFDPSSKNSLFRKLYKSQYDGKTLAAFRQIAKRTGEIIFWNK